MAYTWLNDVKSRQTFYYGPPALITIPANRVAADANVVVNEYTVQAAVTPGSANQLITIPLTYNAPGDSGNTIQDGTLTTQVMVYEVIVTYDNITPPSQIAVGFYRENTADGSAPTTNAILTCNLDASQIDQALLPVWGTTKLKMTTNAAGAGKTFRVQAKILFYTP